MAVLKHIQVHTKLTFREQSTESTFRALFTESDCIVLRSTRVETKKQFRLRDGHKIGQNGKGPLKEKSNLSCLHY